MTNTRIFYMIPEPPPEAENEGHESPDDNNDNGNGNGDDDQQTLFDLSADSSSSCLSILDEHDCLVNILNFLSFQDTNNFSNVSKECYNVRSHKTLDQTRAGTIHLGNGIQSIRELMMKVRKQEWHKSFRGNRTHLHLSGLNCLSPDIESIDQEFIEQCFPLEHVTSLDCSEVQEYNRSGRNRSKIISSNNNGNGNSNSNSSNEDEHSSSSSEDTDENGNSSVDNNSRQFTSSSSSSWMFRYQDYIDKGFAHGLALSLLVPNLREIDVSNLPLTSLGVAWIAENNPKLECIRWNRSLIWPINHPAHDIWRACRNLKELYINDSRLLFGSSSRRHRRRQQRRHRRQRDQNAGGNFNEINNNRNANNNGENDENNDNLSSNGNTTEALWSALTENIQSLVRVSCSRTLWYNHESRFTTIGETETGQASLMRFVRLANNLEWFRSDLTDINVAILKKERPNIVFCR
eukprot:CAMPEP_0168222856 /NCGR_PEP_ID=MMETSP0140_2-20121125/10938_1 /TAXON_ID=44445 /ORGANISM="Pseudo-nitzschia australis, Strain 10249 10 AB" /LENGTH=462 /DNA_ID=CAMNT_0008152575 /DNA_START=134 /DNA_END=1522 /DNA_ORIENTATION=+